MLIAIDIGNSHSVCGVYENDKLLFQWRLETHRQRTEDELYALIEQQFTFHEISRKNIRGFIISNVVPELTFSYQKLAEKYFDLDILFVGTNNIPYKLRYKKTIGADLIVNAEQAFEKYKDNLIILDFGTATTLTYIEKSGVFVGGLILPGLRTMSSSLSQSASLLPKISIEKPDEVITQETVTAMQSGLYWGYVGAMEKWIEKTKQEHGLDCQVIATGGLAKLIADDCNFEHKIEPYLTLDGLNTLYKRYQSTNE